jgi:hypothetical protein
MGKLENCFFEMISPLRFAPVEMTKGGFSIFRGRLKILYI